jgi:hypothetical protein
VRGVDALCMAEYCDTPQSKEGSNSTIMSPENCGVFESLKKRP